MSLNIYVSSGVWARVHTCLHMHVCVEHRGQPQGTDSEMLSTSFDTVSHWPELIHSAPGISLPLLLQHRGCKPQPVFSWMFWVLNWGPHTCKLSTLPDELSRQEESLQANPTFQLKRGTALSSSRSRSRLQPWPNKSPFFFLFIASNKSSEVWHL